MINSMMKLYYSQRSPYVRKVIATLIELNQLDQVEIIKVKTAPLTRLENLASVNPLGKIPILERSDGPPIYDSRVICEYLDSVFQGSLYGQSPDRWESKVVEATSDGMLDAAILMVYEKRYREDKMQSIEWLEGQWGKVQSAVRALNNNWMPYLSGSLKIGHIGVGCALNYIDFRHSNRDWREDNAELSSWYSEFEKRPSMKDSVLIDY